MLKILLSNNSQIKKNQNQRHSLDKKNTYWIFFFIYFDFVFFLIIEIKNNKNEKVKKFTNVKLYGANPKIVIIPSIKGAIKTTNNLLFNSVIKLSLISLFQIYSF